MSCAVFLSSYRNTCESLEELKKETLSCGSCSKLDTNTVHVFYFLISTQQDSEPRPILLFLKKNTFFDTTWLFHHDHFIYPNIIH